MLGPDSTFTTRVVAPGEPANGTVDKLFLVGGGDPLLSTADFRAYLDGDPKTAGTPSTSMETLADAVVAKGVRRVNALVVDDTRQDQVRYLPQWSPNYKAEGQIGPLGALTVNHGFSRFVGTSHTAVDDGALYAGDQFAEDAAGARRDRRTARSPTARSPRGRPRSPRSTPPRSARSSSSR